MIRQVKKIYRRRSQKETWKFSKKKRGISKKTDQKSSNYVFKTQHLPHVYNIVLFLSNVSFIPYAGVEFQLSPMFCAEHEAVQPMARPAGPTVRQRAVAMP